MSRVKIGLIDYGIGNIKSVYSSFKNLDCEIVFSSNPKDFYEIDKILLVGVGAFNNGMKNLHNLGFDDYIKNHIEKGKHIFGICLGMQILFSLGYENYKTEGLDLINGKVVSIKENANLRVPHIGWNNLDLKNFDKMLLLKNIDIDSNFYFVHSFYSIPKNDIEYVTTTYEHLPMCAVIEKDEQIFGTQFHPEKSQNAGIKILKNFLII